MISPKSERGFTAVELLATILIIGVIAAILFPVLGGMVERGKSTQCLSNLRNMGRAAIQYAVEHNGNLPPSYWGGPGGGETIIFYRLLNEYLGPYDQNTQTSQAPKVYRCPSDKKPFLEGTASYGCNVYLGVGKLSSGNTFQIDSGDQQNRRSEIILYVDASSAAMRPGWGGNYEKVEFRHNGICNAVMMDGSAINSFKADSKLLANPVSGYWGAK